MKKLLLFALLFSINLVALENLQSAPTKMGAVEAKTTDISVLSLF